MTPLSEDILRNYQIRKTKQQKSAFIDLLLRNFPELKVQNCNHSRSKNLILGDVSNAEILLSAHYDTCSVLPFPNFITPKNILLYAGYILLILIPIFVIITLCSTLLRLITDNFWIHYFVNLFIYFGLLFLLMAGPPNKHTANDNTSGVITLCELYAGLSPDDKKKVAIIFFDSEESGLIGSRAFKKEYKDILNEKLLINFDCVSDGDYILLSISKNARNKWNIEPYFSNVGKKKPLFERAERIFYPSDQKGFPNAIAVAALNHNKFLGYYMGRIHTARDTVFDKENIRYLCDGIHAFIADIPQKTKASD